MSIHSHFAFNPMLDRYKAEQFVRIYKGPVLRTSSVRGHYAITYESSPGVIAHALLREAYDRKIECVDSRGNVFGRYDSIDNVLNLVAPTLFPRLDYGILPPNHNCATDIAPCTSYDAPPHPNGTTDP
jgi:hypothetical protein